MFRKTANKYGSGLLILFISGFQKAFYSSGSRLPEKFYCYCGSKIFRNSFSAILKKVSKKYNNSESTEPMKKFNSLCRS